MMIETVTNGNERDGMLSLKGIMPRHPQTLACSRGILAAGSLVFGMCLLALLDCSAFASDATAIYEQATDASYNLDFNTAQHGYEMLTQEYPENPSYWNALASVLWLKIAYGQQKLSLESFSGRSLGTKESRDNLDPAEEKHFRDTVAVAIQKADAILSKNPKDVRALYAKGIANGTLASFEGTIKRSYIAAYSKAKMARDLHQQVLKIDPTYDDAQLAIGAYDYVIGVIPGFVRFVLAPFGVRSAGKDVGIQELERAATNGKTTSTDAKMILTVVYTRERQYERAVQLFDAIHAKYPRNFLMELGKASVYGRMERWDDAARVYEEVLAKIQSKKDGYERLRPARVLYSIGTTDISRQQFEKAIETFSRVVSLADASADDKARSYLWLGKLFDSKKDRLKAVEQYDALLALDCSDDLKSEALRYKRHPFGE